MTDQVAGNLGVIARSSAHLRDLWSRDLPAFGLWSSLTDPTVAELLAGSAFDYVCVDLQHGVATFSELPTVLQAMRAAGHAPIVRVPWNDPASIMRALDVGANAVLVPMVNSADDARRAATSCAFPPEGTRSWGPMWGDVRADGALPPTVQNEAAICLVMVETQAAVDALKEIVSVPGVDGVYIGPNDLALGCGFGRATYRDSADVDALIQQIITTCREAGVVAGLHCSDVDMAVHWSQRGAQLLTSAQDTALLRAAADRAWATLCDSTDLTARRGLDRRPGADRKGY
jgi:4-hydroxy-2-oxoheptanedioate aldolase